MPKTKTKPKRKKKKEALHKFGQMGFKQAFTYVLDLLCYAYYVKADNFVSDITFDELEKLYCRIFNEETAPSRAFEREECYTIGVKVVYDYIKKKAKEKNEKEK